jgi:hypothetical protein
MLEIFNIRGFPDAQCGVILFVLDLTGSSRQNEANAWMLQRFPQVMTEQHVFG